MRRRAEPRTAGVRRTAGNRVGDCRRGNPQGHIMRENADSGRGDIFNYPRGRNIFSGDQTFTAHGAMSERSAQSEGFSCGRDGLHGRLCRLPIKNMRSISMAMGTRINVGSVDATASAVWRTTSRRMVG